MRILITGGAGFIGSALVRYLIDQTQHVALNLDKLTYAGNLDSLAQLTQHPRHIFIQADICDALTLDKIFSEHRPDAVMHLAAESHVDRSIDGPGEFIQTNLVGTYTLLQSVLGYWRALPDHAKKTFRFHHISTDEVYGTLGDTGLFTETTPYAPNSPYSASKAGSDHLVRAWHHTYGLPMVITNCSNNYGPFQFPEKLIPLMILNALDGKPLPVYGKGENIRDWLFVDDHVRALLLVLEKGRVGEQYNIGGLNERKNMEVVETLCALLDECLPESRHRPHRQWVQFVTDRPGHDARYAIDASKIQRELGWRPLESFETGLRKTVQWYLDNRLWCERIQSGSYRGERLGLNADGAALI